MCFFAKVATRNVYKLYSIPVISTEISRALKIDYNCSLKCTLLSVTPFWHVMRALSQFSIVYCEERLLFYDNMDLLVHETNSY